MSFSVMSERQVLSTLEQISQPLRAATQSILCRVLPFSSDIMRLTAILTLRQARLSPTKRSDNIFQNLTN